MQPEVGNVAAIRAQLWDAGFRPVPVKSSDKAPLGNDWHQRALLNPPECLRFAPVAHALNTGILCDGLRAIDIDIDDDDLARQCRAAILQRFGRAPLRYRRNAARCLILYRAAQGEPKKLTLAGAKGKIEALGWGQQFVAFGTHPSGADLEWFPDPPNEQPVESLPQITEDDLIVLLNELAPLLGATPISRGNGHDHAPSEPQADPLRLAAALNAIPNGGPSNWEHWNRVGMAVWRATGGSQIGWQAFDAWSARHPAYDPQAALERWEHYATSPPTQIGAGSIFHMATEAASSQEAPTPFAASPLNWDAMEAEESRRWIYGHFLIRGFVSVLGAPGGTGKTAYAFGVAASIATGVAHLDEEVHEPGNVWLYVLEDPLAELHRRLRATVLHHGISRSELEGRLFLDSGRDRPLVIAVRLRDGSVVAAPVVEALIAELRERRICVMVVDPFIRSHRVSENVNEEIDFVASLWTQVATQADCAILLVHHFHKGGQSGDASAFRGASALIDAARAALSLTTMSEREAERFGIQPEDRRFYIRVDNAKLNLAPPPTEAVWLKLASVCLDNGTGDRKPDYVQAVERWEPPSAWDGMPMSTVIRVLDKIQNGPGDREYYSYSASAKDRWAGNVLVEDAGRSPDQAKLILRAWKESGLLLEDKYNSPRFKHTETGRVQVDQTRVSEMRRAITPQNEGEFEG